jgi:nucleoside-diphosphate-sugar epimerase
VLQTEAADPPSVKSITPGLQPGTRVLHSIPLIEIGGDLKDPTPELLGAVGQFASRIVYLSTTGVYGSAPFVDEHTPVAPRSPRESLRVEAERAVLGGPWSSMVLRPAAIYGPGRGVHVAMRQFKFRLSGDGSNYVSRIHVDDLAAHAEAALLTDVPGAFPVADEEPCQSHEIARFCAGLLGLPMLSRGQDFELHDSRRSDRRVDGSAVRRLLKLELKSPSYRQGIPAAIGEEHDAGLE